MKVLPIILLFYIYFQKIDQTKTICMTLVIIIVKNFNYLHSYCRSMQSSFIYLHNRKLTIPQDSDRYEKANKTLYRKQAFKFIYMALLSKLYDMSNLPMIRSHRAYIYTGAVMIIGSISFYRESIPLTKMLTELDQKYQMQYQKHIGSQANKGLSSIFKSSQK